MKKTSLIALITAANAVLSGSTLLTSCDRSITDSESVTSENPEDLLKSKHADTLAALADTLPGIVCWGDSLTSGPGGDAMSYPKSLQNCVNERLCALYDPTAALSDEEKALLQNNPSDKSNLTVDIPVINMGVGGETTNTILARNGAVPFLTDGSITIPSECKPVRIRLTCESGAPVAPLLQGNAGMESVTIGGIKGVITHGQGYFFTRSEPGEETKIPDGTVIVTEGSGKYLDYLPVIFIGQNGGYTGYFDLVDQQRAIIEHQTKNGDRYIIIGMHTTTPGYREDLEELMVEEFGDKYINLREYMATDAMSDAGLTPTERDLERMELGFTPYSLLSIDELHFNEAGYELIGKLVYERMDKLGYFDGAKLALGINEQ